MTRREALASLAGTLLAPSEAAVIKLMPGVPVVLDPAEAAPLRLAVSDLCRDLEKVLGKPSPVVDRAPNAPCLVVTSKSATVRGVEAHAVSARNNRVVLEGADTRGAIYATYEFADRFLDVPPLWFWASWTPPQKTHVVVPVNTNLRFAPARVRWRAWFPNDQDLLTAWEKKTPENEEALFETLLRLKLNVLDIDNIRDYPAPNLGLRRARRATARGLAVTPTHIAPLGTTLGAWNEFWTLVKKRKTPPAITLDEPTLFDEFWTYHIELVRREKLEMIWMIGFRGAGDQGFFVVVPGAPQDDAGRARVIQTMMERQVALLKKVTGETAPLMRTVLYNENSDYFAQNLLRPPTDSALIWNFVNARRDHFPARDIQHFRPPAGRPVGYYLNLQFTSTGAHLAAGEGPWKMEKNYRFVQSAGPGPLVFSVVNVGNVREFVVEAAANAALVWDGNRYNTDAFLARFCERYFGRAHASDVAALFRGFYQAYWQQKKPDLPGFERQYLFQDQRIARAGALLLGLLEKNAAFDPDPFDDRGTGFFRIVPADSDAPTQVEAVRKGMTAAAAAFASVARAADALGPQLPAPGRVFFNDTLRAPAHFLLAAHRWLAALARAYADAPSRSVALAEAARAARAMRTALGTAEHDRFVGWYDGERLFGVRTLAARTNALADWQSRASPR